MSDCYDDRDYLDYEADPDIAEVEDGLCGTNSDPEAGPYQRGQHPDHHYHDDGEDEEVASISHAPVVDFHELLSKTHMKSLSPDCKHCASFLEVMGAPSLAHSDKEGPCHPHQEENL